MYLSVCGLLISTTILDLFILQKDVCGGLQQFYFFLIKKPPGFIHVCCGYALYMEVYFTTANPPGSDSFRLYYFTISPLYYTRSRQQVIYEPVLLAGSNFIHPSVMIQDVYHKLQAEILVE